MIETSLIRLDEALQCGLKLYEGKKVVLPSGDDADIYGFIVIEDDMLSLLIDMPPLGECQVFSNRAMFLMDNKLHRFPIFSTVCKVSENRYDLYMLYLVRFSSLLSGWDLKAYKYYFGDRNIISNLRKLNDVQIEENTAYYTPYKNDLYFESRSKLRAIGSGVAVVTRRISKKTDVIKYEIFDAHSLRMERNE